jgi:hypothetical protein
MPYLIYSETPQEILGALRHANRAILVLILVMFFCVAKDALGSAGLVQTVAASAANSGAVNALSVSFPQNSAAGDLILVGFDFGANVSPSSITDTQGNAFAQVGTRLNSPGGAGSAVYYARNIKGGADTVTVNLTATSAYLEIYLTEYSGMDQMNPVDTQSGASGSAGFVSSGYASTTVADDVIYGYCVGDWDCTVASGFSALSTLDGNLLEAQTAGDPGNYAAAASANSGWTMQMVALKPAPAAGVPEITSATTGSGTVGSAISYQITATNAPTSYAATGLPWGLAVNSATGLISGTPAVAGTSSVILSASNSTGTGSATLTFSAIPAPALVQATSSYASGAASALSFSFPQNSVAGDLIVVGLDFAANAALSSINDTQGNAYTQIGAPLTSPGGAESGVYYAQNIRGGADTVTVTLTANSPYLEVYLTEYTGVAQTNPIDAQAGATGSAGAVSSGNLTTTAAGEVLYGFCVGDWACTVGPYFTSLSTLHSNLVEDTIAGNPGAYATTGFANEGWTMQAVALKPASLALTPLAEASNFGVPTISLSNTNLSFVTSAVAIASAVQTIFVTNTGSATLNIASINLTGANPSDFTQVNTCAQPVGMGGNCTIAVLFTPLFSGNGVASLTVADNASGSPQSVSLSGSIGHNVSMSWTGSATPGVVGYNVYRGTSPGSEGSTPLNPAPINGSNYTDANVTAGATYYYVVTSVASNGVTQSPASSEAVAQVPSP